MSDTAPRLTEALQGRYRIERELGAGGMATVYLAHDLKHDRKVALKVLKPELAAVVGSERFLTEIRTTANLQHPHILPLFDSGEAAGFLFFVMPYVEGESLRDRLDREKQLPVDEAVRIASEVADALAHAHAKGVIHRDIKPANILLRDGRVQVADFGIALAVQQAGGTRLTETGLSVGTPHYMSPEQASGDRELDGRSDVYSLGCVLYEMLAGEPPHTGATAQSILAKILTDEPRPLSQLRRSVPAHVETAVQAALEKLPADRPANADAFVVAVRNRSTGMFGDRPRKRGSVRSWKRIAILACSIATGATALGLWLCLEGPQRESPGGGRVVRSVIGETRYLTYGNSVAISPDGETAVFAGADGFDHRLFRRRLDDLMPTPIPGTEGARTPFFSPDGQWIGFTRDLGIEKVRLEGGSVVPVMEDSVGVGGGATWHEGWIYFVLWRGEGLGPVVRIPQDGGQLDTIVAQDPSRPRDLAWWGHLPGEHALLFTEFGAPHLAVFDLETAALRVDSTRGARQPVFVPPATLVYGRSDGTILAAPFDPQRAMFTGPPVSLATGVEVINETLQFAVSATGALVYAEDQGDELVRESLDGKTRQAVTSERKNFQQAPSISPDGSQVAISVFEASGQEIRVYDTAGRGQDRTRGERAGWPVWSPDGLWLTYGWEGRGIVRRPSSGGADVEFLVTGSGGWIPTAWSPAGDRLAYYLNSAWRGWILDSTTGDSELMGEDLSFFGPADFSPDGRLIAIQSGHLEQTEIYVQRVEGGSPGGPRVRVSFEGGIAPHWAGDSRTLYYIRWQADRPRAHLVSVEIETTPVIAAGPETVLSDWSGEAINYAYRFDLHPNGEELVRVRSTPTRRLVLVQNWQSLLRGEP